MIPYNPLLKPPLGTPINKARARQLGLVYYGLMNEGSGGKVLDLSGNSYDLTAGGGPTWVPGKFGPATHYVAASNQYFYRDCIPITSLPYTVFCWVKAGENNPAADRYFFYYGPSGSTSIWFSLNFNTSGQITAWDRTTNALATTTVDYADNNWHFVVAIIRAYATGTTIDLYVDGTFDVSHYAGGAGVPDMSTYNRIALGMLRDDSPSAGFTGDISSAGMYNRALSASEIAQLYWNPFWLLKDSNEDAILGVISGAQTYEEFNRTVTAVVSADESDIQQKKELTKTITAEASSSETDIQQMVEASKSVTAVASVSCSDTLLMSNRIGTELADNGCFDDWTTDNPDDWTVAGEVGNDPEVSEVGISESHGGAGTGCCNLFTTNDIVMIRQSPTLVIGDTYQVKIDISAISGTLLVSDPLQSQFEFPELTTTGLKTLEFMATTTTCWLAVYTKDGEVCDITFDCVSLKRIVAARASVSETDVQQMDDSEKTVTVLASVSEADIQQMVEPDRTVSAAASVSCTDSLGEETYEEFNRTVTAVVSADESDIQQMVEVGKLAEAAVLVSCTDSLILAETSRIVTAAASVICTDVQQMIESEKSVEAAASVSCTDQMVGAYIEHDRTVTVAASASCIDEHKMVEADKSVEAAASSSKTDNQQMVETNRTITAAGTIACSDLMVMTETLNVEAAASVVCTDIASFVDLNLTVTAAASASCADSLVGVFVVAAYVVLRQVT